MWLILDERVFRKERTVQHSMRVSYVGQVGDFCSARPELMGAIKTHCNAIANLKAKGMESLCWTLQDPLPETVIRIMRVTPVVHCTMGSVQINSQTQVI